MTHIKYCKLSLPNQHQGKIPILKEIMPLQEKTNTRMVSKCSECGRTKKKWFILKTIV